MDNLPFQAGQFDIAIFNAAPHYSANCEQTLREVVRCLRRPGCMVAADTPFYPSEQDGQTMVAEKPSMFIRKFGVSVGDMRSREYLTPQAFGYRVALHLRGKVHKPRYGVGWMIRPVKAGLLGRRKPSKFYLLVAAVGAQERRA